MKQFFIAVLFLVFCTKTFSQNSYDCLIIFKDKNTALHSIDKPYTFLSSKAIARRQNQQIAITEMDFPINDTYVKAIAALGVTVKNKSRWMNAVWVKATNTENSKAIAALPFVKSITTFENKRDVKQVKFEIESNNAYSASKSLQEITAINYGASIGQASQIGATCMHNLGYTGRGMTIAVLDAGFFNVNILPAFDSLRLQNRLLGTRDFVTGDTMVFEDYPHGMNVLSCMTGNLPGQLVGTAPHAKFWLLRTEDAATETMQEEFNWLVGAEFADSVGADIINSSLGYSYFDNTADNHTYADMNGRTTIISKAAVWAARVGILVVSSAGNSGGSPWYKITAPADADSILTIGAVDLSGTIASFSSRGPTFDGRIKPTTVACGSDAVIAASSGGTVTSSGTSFSSPITAGAVACLWQAHPSRTNMEIINAIIQSASQYTMPDTIKGYGIPNFCLANSLLTSIDNNSISEESINVFPNPFQSGFQLNFYSTQKQKIEITLLNICGKTISTDYGSTIPNQTNTFLINTSIDLPKGFYLVRIITNEKAIVKKILKQ